MRLEGLQTDIMLNQNLSSKDNSSSQHFALKKSSAAQTLASSEELERTEREAVLKAIIERLSYAAFGRSFELDTRLAALLRAVQGDADASGLKTVFELLDSCPQIASSRDASSSPDEAIDLNIPGDVPGSRRGGSPSAGKRPNAIAANEGVGQCQSNTAQAISNAFGIFLSRVQPFVEYQELAPQIETDSESGASLREPIEKAVRLVQALFKHIRILKQEKNELQRLVTNADEQLRQILVHLEGQRGGTRQAEDSTLELNRLVLDEMEGLVNAVEDSNDIGALRARVHTRIVAIESHLNSFKEQEQSRHSEQLAHSERLCQQVRELETKSKELSEQLKENERLILLDTLTGVANRAAYKRRFMCEQQAVAQEGHSSWLVVWDIDRFKRINDGYGHKAGDRVLRAIAQYLERNIRKDDFVARYGGEEFVMLLKDLTEEAALRTVNQLREGIARLGFHFKSKPVEITTSCGITRLLPDNEEEVLFERADAALYRAKTAGRNRCILA